MCSVRVPCGFLGLLTLLVEVRKVAVGACSMIANDPAMGACWWAVPRYMLDGVKPANDWHLQWQT
jgi:hypothetical protein